MRFRLALIAFALTLPLHTALGVDQEHRAEARAMVNKSLAWLRARQDGATGAWGLNPAPNAPQFPAITALALNALLLDPRTDHRDRAVSSAVSYLLSHRQPDGGIYDRVLPSYNTAISVSALARVRTPEAASAVLAAQDFLRSLQWSEDSIGDASKDTGKVSRDHPFYGGVGYGGSGRPDNSNLAMFIQAMHDSGVSTEDPAYQRALVFLARTQMLGSVNDMPYAKGSHQGGFIYSTTPDKKPESLGVGESKAGTIEETLDDGTRVSRLRAYGSMTYAGFKSYIYADLPRDDPRVTAAHDWLRRNFTVTENPGVGTDGLYYYYLTMARALDAWGEPVIHTLNPDNSPAESIDWANALIDRLKTLQNDDGSFRSVDDRWMEDNPVLITAYATISLHHAIN